MLNIMKGVGLANNLAHALDNSEATSGVYKNWTDEYIDQLTTRKGKRKILGPMLDVLRGDAEIVPKQRIIDLNSVKIGDQDIHPDIGQGADQGVVIDNHKLCADDGTLQNQLVLGEFKIGVASHDKTDFYRHHQHLIDSGELSVEETHIAVPNNTDAFKLDTSIFLPKYLIGKKLPGIALRNFYVENPHHMPSYFPHLLLFWGTICKYGTCYYVPGIWEGNAYGRRICMYEVVDGKDVIVSREHVKDASAVFI